MKDIERAMEFIKDDYSHYDYVEYLGELDGFRVYMPLFYEKDAHIGFPRYIFLNDEEIRWAENEEIEDVIVNFLDEDEDDE